MIGLDLTIEEQDHIRFAMRYLRSRCGGWKPLSHVLGFKPRQMVKMRAGEKSVSPKMVIRIAKLAGVAVDDILSGKFPPPGTCPKCGYCADGGQA